MSQILIACSASLFVIVGAAALSHRVFWPIIERPVYALQRLGIARRGKLMGSVGLLFLGVAFGVVPNWLKDIVSSLSG